MKISQIIEKLEKYKDNIGDVNVAIFGIDEYGYAISMDNFYIIKSESIGYIMDGNGNEV